VPRRRPLIAVVDDDKLLRDTTMDLLESAGFSADRFGSPADLLKSKRLKHFDCLITDLRMPQMTGLELHLRLLAMKYRIPTIILTAYPDERITDPAVAASTWRRELEGWHRTWLRRGLNVSILLGEWGYSTQINVNDATQQSVIQAEVSKAFPRIPFLVGANYWVGPGMVGDGGYTHILVPDRVSEWRFRPAAVVVSSFYAAMNKPPGK